MQQPRDPFSPQPQGGVLSLLLALSLLFTVLSFGVWDGERGSGAVSAAVSHVEDFLSSHEAIAVFLGWEEGFPS